ncbi:GNAT family N-acetyltransferase [Dinoroseobacter sp. S76]|uniref:GNAT family N-acetyltransferase n=1 Tax=Dinoroseobacter sp. S76 TaxID=3415124 RepID=UPI003C7E7008
MPGSSTDLILRPRLAADLDALCDVWEAATRSTHPFLSDAQIAAERARLEGDYFPATQTLVALRAGQIVGFASLTRGQELAGLFVAPEAQRSGIGRALCAELCAEQDVTLEVYTLNMHGRAAYHRLGFAETGRRMDPETGLERVQMRLVESPAAPAM